MFRMLDIAFSKFLITRSLGSCKAQVIKRAVQRFQKRKEREPALKLQAPGHPHTLTGKHSKW